MTETPIPLWRSIVQYWAYNMELIHRWKMEWPGFGYTDEEKEQLAALASGLSFWQYFAFWVLNAMFFIGLAGFVVFFGVLPVALLLDPQHQSGGVFLGCLASGTVVCLGFGIPAAMALTATTLNFVTRPSHGGGVSDEQAAALYDKMNRQLTRMGVILGVLLIPLVLFGRTKIGGHVIELVQHLIVVIAPFAWIITILRVLAPKLKSKK